MNISYGYTAVAAGAADPAKVDKYTTQAKSANFTAAPGVIYVVDTTAGTVTATLPAANSAGQQLVIQRVAGTAAVVVQRAGSDTIGSSATSASLVLDNEVWEFVSSGAGSWIVIGGNKTLTTLDGRYGQSMLASGEETVSRVGALTSVTLASGTFYLCPFTARKTETTANVRIESTSIASSGLTLGRLGLYSIASNGDGTLVASTANDTTLLNTTNAVYTKAWSTPYAKQAGQRYAVGILTVGTTAGSIVALINGNTAEGAFGPRIAGRLFGQSDLPASFTDASLSGTGAMPYAAVLP